MLLTRIDLRGQSRPFDRLLPAPDDAGADVRADVAAIIDEVRQDGDAALFAFTKRFDGVELSSLRVPTEEIDAATGRVTPELRAALEAAWVRICAYHAAEGTPPADLVSEGVTVRHLIRPVERAGCYAPGGRARYPSTVLMCAAPARVAGVAEVVLFVPPAPDGRVDDATLTAARIAGIDEVYRVGGAQAIAAMAYGTETIAPVDVVVGPGNLYVAEAKRQVAGSVGIASAFAGPSEVVVIADDSTPAELAAIDLMVQAEHGPDGLSWLITWSPAKADEVEAALEALVVRSPRRGDLESTFAHGGYCCVVDDSADALEVANVVAPEHLELLFDGAESHLDAVRRAGAVFCGVASPASFGDYVAGPNHVLPTNRSARFSSALRADDFRRHIHAVTVTPEALDALGHHVIALAEAEGLVAHADSIRLRR
jgi:histidinol dehydrogenase